jgi:hypothetical protein
MIDLPQYALWILLIAALGWLIPHLLRVSREKHAKQISDKKTSQLSNAERDILHECANVDSWEKGHLWIMKVDAFGRWVRAGKRDFCSQTDPSVQARYMDAFESLYRSGCFRHEDGLLYRLTGIGYDRAQKDT